ncbi:MAG: HipA domain-containing protein [Deltaproteobacteria bacterium]|nr:HipA domain-containing protein [Deltaproteobacteria bacterium]
MAPAGIAPAGILISNTDDHPRNHAIIAKEQNWHLSPVYDLIPANPISIERRDLALVCGDWGRFANAKNLLSQVSRFLLTIEQATKILDSMEAMIKQNWYRVCRNAGVTEKDCDLLKGSFIYPGFRYQIID